MFRFFFFLLLIAAIIAYGLRYVWLLVLKTHNKEQEVFGKTVKKLDVYQEDDSDESY